MAAQRHRLPAHKTRGQILSAVAQNQVVVISGETGPPLIFIIHEILSWINMNQEMTMPIRYAIGWLHGKTACCQWQQASMCAGITISAMVVHVWIQARFSTTWQQNEVQGMPVQS